MTRYQTWIVGLVLLGIAAPTDAATSTLSTRNTEVPFSYLVGGVREWPILSRGLREDEDIFLQAKVNGAVVRGRVLEVAGLQLKVTRLGWFSVKSTAETDESLEFEWGVEKDGEIIESQRIKLQPAPPARPLSYVADLVDDLIRIFWDSGSRQFRPLSKDGFDQYFRRLQGQGIERLIVWQSPFPLIADPENYKQEDWDRFESQANAILECGELNESMRKTPQLKSYQWLGMLMRLRLSGDFDRWFTQSAHEHGIRLTASFRPFEAALTKYYEVPTFDADGEYLWGFLPGANPTVNYRPHEVGFAHYREILRSMGRGAEAHTASLQLGGIGDAEAIAARWNRGERDLELLAAQIPPLDGSSFVLVRQEDATFRLVRYATMRSNVHSRLLRLDDVRMRAEGDRLVIDKVVLPESHRYLWLRSRSESGGAISLPAVPDVTLLSSAGNRLGRVNVYYSMTGESQKARSTQVAGIPPNGLFRTEFQAIEASIDQLRARNRDSWLLGEGTVVVDRGENWSVEMTDFLRPRAREFVVAELKTILGHDAFDEIIVNTRSHTQLSGSTGDGVDGVRPMAHYRLNGKNYFHYGIDRAYAPLALAESQLLQSAKVERVTTWQSGEWQEPCQTAESPFLWRLERNRAVAGGMRELLVDLEREFPGIRIRAVIPQSEAVIRATEEAIAKMPKPGGGVYGKDYFRHVWSSLNYIPAIGEGMAMVDLRGLSVEPVFLGVRFAPDQGPLNAFVDRAIQDLADNRGSSYRGAHSFFYEAQETLRGAYRETKRSRREEIICNLLARDEVNEVLLYEAADWTYNLPFSDRELSGHRFLDKYNK